MATGTLIARLVIRIGVIAALVVITSCTPDRTHVSNRPPATEPTPVTSTSTTTPMTTVEISSATTDATSEETGQRTGEQPGTTPGATVNAEIDPAEDPFGIRESTPRLPGNPAVRWEVRIDRVSIPTAVATDSLVIFRAIGQTGEHLLIALNRTNGDPAWEIADEGQQIQRLNLFDDVLFVNWVRTSGASSASGLDPVTGEELWSFDIRAESAADPFVDGRFLKMIAPGESRDVQLLDVHTGEVSNMYVPGGIGARGWVERRGAAVIELAADDLEPLSEPVPLGDLANTARSIVMLTDSVTLAADGVLVVLDHHGAAVGTGDDIEVTTLRPVAANSPLVIIEHLGETAVYDTASNTVRWVREGIFLPLWIVDGVPISLVRLENGWELLSLETGVARCVFGSTDYPDPSRFGFFDGRAAFNDRCERMWTLDIDDGAEATVVDRGLLVVETIGDETVLRLFD